MNPGPPEGVPEVVGFGVLVDDIVLPDGTTHMGVLGGGGIQTVFGMRAGSDRVGLVASVGTDWADPVYAWLAASGVDARGVQVRPEPTPRAWQLLEEDERRTQVWRVPPEAVRTHLALVPERVPPSYRRARGFHLGIHPHDFDLDFLGWLGQAGGVVSVETFCPAESPVPRARLEALFQVVHLFSANELEAVSLLGPLEPPALARSFLDLGASVVVLRLGQEGSLVGERASGRLLHIPAVPVAVAHPIGAGNAYCGAFLAGWLHTGDLATAGVYGAAAASFLVESVAPPVFGPTISEELRRRAQALRVRPISL